MMRAPIDKQDIQRVREAIKAHQKRIDGHRDHQTPKAVQSPVQWPKCAGCRLDGKCEYQAEELEHGVEHTDNCPKIRGSYQAGRPVTT